MAVLSHDRHPSHVRRVVRMAQRLLQAAAGCGVADGASCGHLQLRIGVHTAALTAGAAPSAEAG